MATEQFCLKWNDFHSNICSAVSDIRREEDFLDVTLVCDGDTALAHRLVLSACSPLFRAMLKKNSHPHPMIYLRGIRFADMVAILNFMYKGEVNVNQEDLQLFLAAAEELRIKGLSQVASAECSQSNGTATTTSSTTSQPHAKSQPTASSGTGESKVFAQKQPRAPDPAGDEETASTKRPRMSESLGHESPESDPVSGKSSAGEEEEPEPESSGQLTVKPEFNSTGQDQDEVEDEDSNSNQANLLDCLVQAQSYAFHQQGFSGSYPGGSGGRSGGAGDSSPQPAMKFHPAGGMPYEMHRLGGRNEDGLAHVVVMKTFRGWHCPHCSYVSPSQKGNLKVHILNRHANPGESFGCMYCGKHLSSRSSLQVHISQVHREQNKAKRMLEERMKISSLEEKLKHEMASGIMASGTAEALKQALQQEEKLKLDMSEMFRNQDEKNKFHEITTHSGALTIQALPNHSSRSDSPAGMREMNHSPSFSLLQQGFQSSLQGFQFPGGQQFPAGYDTQVVYPQSPGEDGTGSE